MIVYEVVSVDQKKYHVHRLMTLDKNYMIEKLSKPFIFQNFGIERCGNAVIDHAEKKLIVPITFENGSAYLANIELNSLQSILELIEASSGRYQAIVPNPEEFFKLKTELIHIIETEKDETNPFAIPFKPKDNLTDDDYKEIQKELKELKVTEYLKTIYQDPAMEPSKYTTLEDSENRCTKGSKQVLIDSDKNLSPVKKLEKIGYGSDMCVMSFSSYNKHYPDLLKSIPDALKQTGFNGYFYYRLGGYPNPTGQEAQFIGVPYAFKIFMMLEAYKMGFTKIIWIDASMLPLNDPTILFTLLDSSETYFYGYAKDEFANILPPIKRLLKDFTGTDVLAHNHVCAGIMGLKMNSRIVTIS